MLDIWYCRLALAALAFGVFASLTPLGAAETAAGIVMAVTGTTDPPLSAMTEIAADSPIKLGSDGKLTFLDYARCKLVTVSGGTLTLSPTDYKTDGHIDSEADGPCPQVYAVSGGGGTTQVTGGLILRGIRIGSVPPRWPVNAQFLLTGPGAGNIRAAAIYPEDHQDTPAATLTVKDGRAVEPPGALPPLPNARYILRLTTGASDKASEVTFVGVTPSDAQPVVVLRLD
jgi:hypothetical protein